MNEPTRVPALTAFAVHEGSGEVFKLEDVFMADMALTLGLDVTEFLSEDLIFSTLSVNCTPLEEHQDNIEDFLTDGERYALHFYLPKDLVRLSGLFVQIRDSAEGTVEVVFEGERKEGAAMTKIPHLKMDFTAIAA